MKLKKYELVRAIDKAKSVVPKKPVKPALGGVLVSKGYLTAASPEMTIQVKLEGAEDESFIIPTKAFDLIKNLPEGDIDIECDAKNVVTIRMDKIKNSYQSFPAEDFVYRKMNDGGENETVLPGKSFMEGLSHVIYAVADKSPGHPVLEGVYFESEGKHLNLAATDGHVLCWDRIDADGIPSLKLIVPKAAAKKLISMGMDDDVSLSYDENSAIFRTDSYTVYTRLIYGDYISYQKMFGDSDSYTITNREELIGAMTRAKMCTDDNVPATFDISGKEISVILRDTVTTYQEKVPVMEEIRKPIKIGFDSRLVLETIKSFTCENITLNFTSPTLPMIVQAEDSDMRALVLPVRLK